MSFIGMSGTLPNIEDQIAMGVFDSFQIPYSAVEREYEEIITRAAASGAGVVIRGGVAKGIPAAPRPKLAGLLGSVAKCSPVAVKAKVARLVPERYRGEFRRRQSRFNEADLDELLGDMSKMEFLLRFTISHPDMTTTIVGTSNPEHLKSNLAAAAKGPLPIDLYNEAKQRLTETVPSRYERTARLDRSTNDVKDITGAPKR